MESLRKPPTPLPKCKRLKRKTSSDLPMVADGACQGGPNVHAAVSALVEKVSSQSDAFADFYYSLERMRQRNLAEILASQETAAKTPAPEELQQRDSAEEGEDASTTTRALPPKESTLARGLLATKRDPTKMMFSQLDALHNGKMRAALNEALTQLSALEDVVLPAVEARIEARRKEALASAERAINTLSSKVREAEEEEGNVDAAIWEAETVLTLLTTQASTMRRVISKRHEITETGLEEVLAAEAEEELQRQEGASRAAADVLRSAAIGL